MKFYSTELKQLFESVEDLEKAEAAAKKAAEEKEKAAKEAAERKAKLAETRKARAKEVEDAYKKVADAEKEYHKLLNAFVKDFGSYHYSINTINDGFNDFFDTIFRIL